MTTAQWPCLGVQADEIVASVLLDTRCSPDLAACGDGDRARTYQPLTGLRSELLHEMLAYPAQLYRLDILNGKFGVILGQEVAPT